MLTMTQKNHIRKMYFEQGMNISEISRKTGFDRKTVKTYVEKDNWSEEPKLNPAVNSQIKLGKFLK
jgi:transposase